MSTSLVFLFLSEPWCYIGRYIARASTSNPRSLTVLHVHGMMYLEMCYSLVFTICICSPLRGYPYGIVMLVLVLVNLVDIGICISIDINTGISLLVSSVAFAFTGLHCHWH